MSFTHLTIGLIGGGNMARALVGGLLQAGHPAARLLIAEPDTGQRALLTGLHRDLGVRADNAAVAAAADVLVLAVKPQVMAVVCRALGDAPRRPGQLVLSVAAGITLADLRGWLGAATPLVRIMPNQPATVRAGISALVASPAVGPGERQMAEYVVTAAGRVVWLGDEALMDAVTAVSGSGPAYFYLLMEHMERAARDLGLPADLAAVLTRETALGAARVVAETGTEPAALRAAVTSPGGTTAAALQVFADASLDMIVRRALVAARDRSAELGAGLATPGPSPDQARRD
ncbi:MAG: pyrroline-5-carboxylate reductase [Gammaproteobacteria bacterium]|nr:pyrroline-5-carboxylate reductase [Gammaproteobacteria bacterium]